MSRDGAEGSVSLEMPGLATGADHQEKNWLVEPDSPQSSSFRNKNQEDSNLTIEFFDSDCMDRKSTSSRASKCSKSSSISLEYNTSHSFTNLSEGTKCAFCLIDSLNNESLQLDLDQTLQSYAGSVAEFEGRLNNSNSQCSEICQFHHSFFEKRALIEECLALYHWLSSKGSEDHNLSLQDDDLDSFCTFDTEDDPDSRLLNSQSRISWVCKSEKKRIFCKFSRKKTPGIKGTQEVLNMSKEQKGVQLLEQIVLIVCRNSRSPRSAIELSFLTNDTRHYSTFGSHSTAGFAPAPRDQAEVVEKENRVKRKKEPPDDSSSTLKILH